MNLKHSKDSVAFSLSIKLVKGEKKREISAKERGDDIYMVRAFV